MPAARAQPCWRPGGFDEYAAVQTASANTAITAMYIWVPIAMNIASVITMCFYDLDKNYANIVKELEARRLEADRSDVAASPSSNR